MRTLLVLLSLVLSGCGTLHIGRHVTAANYNENAKDSSAVNVASPNATNIAGTVDTKAGKGGKVKADDVEAAGLFVVAAGNDIAQDKPISTDAAVTRQTGNKGTGSAAKESTTSADGGTDSTSVAPNVNLTGQGATTSE